MLPDLRGDFKNEAASDASAGKRTVYEMKSGGLLEVDTSLPGIIAMSMTPPPFNPHWLRVAAYNVPSGDGRDEYMRRLLDGLSSEWGLRFPSAMPVVDGYRAGFLFEGEPAFEMPDGWSGVAGEPCAGYQTLRDAQGRLRARYRLGGGESEPELTFMPRLSFTNEICASYRWEEGPDERGWKSFGSYPYFMPTIKLDGKDAVPCFVYAHPGMWPLEGCDFTRLRAEARQIEKAQRHIAKAFKEAFPGAFIECGTDREIITYGAESMTASIPHHGDVFAHWDDKTEPRLAELRAALEKDVPHILGADNSLVLKAFPDAADRAAFKENPPFYNPPQAKFWQRPIWAGTRALRFLRIGN